MAKHYISNTKYFKTDRCTFNIINCDNQCTLYIIGAYKKAGNKLKNNNNQKNILLR